MKYAKVYDNTGVQSMRIHYLAFGTPQQQLGLSLQCACLGMDLLLKLVAVNRNGWCIGGSLPRQQGWL